MFSKRGTRVQEFISRKIPWRRKWQLTPILLSGKSHGPEEPGGPQSMGLERIGYNSTYIPTHPHTHACRRAHAHTHTHTHSVEITAVKMRADTYYNCNYTIAVTILPGQNFFSDIRLYEFSIHRLFEYMLETNLLGHV